MSGKPNTAFLSPVQRRIGAAAVVCVSVLVIVGFAGAMFWLLGRFVAAFSVALWPVVIAGLLSLLLQPVCACLERRLRLPRAAAIGVLYLAVALACVALALVVLPVVFQQLGAFIKALPALWEDVSGRAPAWLAQWGGGGAAFGNAAPVPAGAGEGDLAAAGAEWLKSLAGLSLPALAKAGGQVREFFAKVAGAAIIPVYLFYLMDMRRDFFEDLRRESGFLPASLREDLHFLARQFTDILLGYFRGQLLIGGILGVLLAAGFSLAGLKFGLLIGLFAGLLNVVPYLGTMLGLGVALPLAYFQADGGAGRLAAVVVVFLLAQLFEGYWLTPKVMGKTTGLHPMAIIFSIFFWGIALDGLLGMILAVPLTAFFVIFWRLLKVKYLRAPEKVPAAQ